MCRRASTVPPAALLLVPPSKITGDPFYPAQHAIASASLTAPGLAVGSRRPPPSRLRSNCDDMISIPFSHWSVSLSKDRPAQMRQFSCPSTGPPPPPS
ncbi:hypothetical protein VTN00DRAFT_6723 [Thermoascus crustaceus]|uniref:uncharacterized protein n=1 Tax=Thermoascus crustaceus TaxID=5088 RepID=UPI0037423D8F